MFIVELSKTFAILLPALPLPNKISLSYLLTDSCLFIA